MTLSIGLDFGTTNTVATVVNAAGQLEAVHFVHENEAFDAFIRVPFVPFVANSALRDLCGSAVNPFEGLSKTV